MGNTRRVLRFTHTPTRGMFSMPLPHRDHTGYHLLYLEIHKIPLTGQELRERRRAGIIEVGGKQPENPPAPPKAQAYPPAPPISSGLGPYRYPRARDNE